MREQDVAQVVGEHAVVLLGHCTVEAPQARFDVRDRDPELHGGERRCQRGVDVAGNHAEADLTLAQHGLDPHERLRGLLGVGPGADGEELVRPRHPQFTEEDVRHSVVVVLPGVQERELQARVERGQLPVHRSRFHEVRPGADDEADASRHAEDPILGSTLAHVLALKLIFWLSLVALLWTHALYPLAAALLARVRTRRVRKAAIEPTVTVIVAAYNEEPVIERRLENLLALDYPADRLQIVVTSDASTDRTHELVARFGDRVRLIVNPRGGKVAAQNRAVRETSAEIVAFSDANATWAPDALRELVANFADPDVAYVCGRLVLEAADGSNKEGVYWRYELAQREAESRLGSITGGNGSIYAVRRSDYVEVDPKWGHDLSLPYRMVQAGRRAVYEPAAKAFERPTPSNETEYRRKVRMFEHCWEITLRGSMFRRLPPGYLVEIISHRLLRYGSGVLHLTLLASSIALLGDGWAYGIVLAGQVALIAAAVAGVRIARYYTLVTWATVVSLWNYLRRGVPATWEAAEGTR